jgi:hypothetical protein
MPQKNDIAINFTTTEVNDTLAAINAVKARLMPRLKSVADIRELPKLGPKNVSFVQKSLEYAKQYPDLIPTYLKVEDYSIDLSDFNYLRLLEECVQPLLDAITDSKTLSGSEAYQAALMFYRNVKNAAVDNVLNSKSVYADLSERFPGAPSGSKGSS